MLSGNIPHDPYAPINPRTPTPGHSGALAGDSQHYISLLVNQVISKENEAYSPVCPGAGGAGIYIDRCIIFAVVIKLRLELMNTY